VLAIRAYAVSPEQVGFNCPINLKIKIERSDGKTEFECVDEKGLKAGPTKTYDKDGQLTSSGFYVDDNWSGTWTWFDGGKKTDEGEYRDGIKNGFHRKWYSNGNLESEEYFINGQPSGLQRTFYFEGNVATEDNYSNGKISETRFAENSTVVAVGDFDEHKNKVDVWKYYWPNGNRRMLETYRKENDDDFYEQLAQIAIFDEAGNEVSPALLPTSCLPASPGFRR
jgi:antitoxin component YwqK of YwqJK toxin-antitoxin module